MKNTLPEGYQPSPDEKFMNDNQVIYFRNKLMDWKDEILRESKETLNHLQEDSQKEPDIADRASSETDWSIELRTRDRQRKLITKIDAAIERLRKDIEPGRGGRGECADENEDRPELVGLEFIARAGV